MTIYESPKPHPSKPHPCNMPQAKTEVALQFSECCAAETALQHWLFCSAEVIWTNSCAAANEKLHCNIEKAALQESGAFLQRFPAGFKPPRLGTHVSKPCFSMLASATLSLSCTCACEGCGRYHSLIGGHLKPVTLKPVIRISFRIFRVFASAFSRPHFPVRFPRFRSAESPQTLVFLGWEGRPHFPHFPCIGFESLISKIRPTGFRMTGLR